jgi:hypothetical protein
MVVSGVDASANTSAIPVCVEMTAEQPQPEGSAERNSLRELMPSFGYTVADATRRCAG